MYVCVSADGIANKKVSYRKQIARQHSCQKFFFQYSLITVQNLVNVSHNVLACEGSQEFVGTVLDVVPRPRG